MNRTLRLPQLLTAVTRVCMVMLLVVMLTFSDFARLSAWAQELPPRSIASFDLSADWTEPDQFYDFPYPSDLRLDPNKHPDLSGFPVFTKSLTACRISRMCVIGPLLCGFVLRSLGTH
ncbi:MAG: hypothetical protein AAFZ49_19515, partial [Cyanobacteria bacterium J06659_2]